MAPQCHCSSSAALFGRMTQSKSGFFVITSRKKFLHYLDYASRQSIETLLFLCDEIGAKNFQSKIGQVIIMFCCKHQCPAHNDCPLAWDSEEPRKFFIYFKSKSCQ
ncbi:hypothetical protein MtrunA17_Chr1g0190461 [Medicago truncatula]|uniref:Uncharacterized protein n=1 Tax=Medicago truncatula TaxID=3880 RepID=A0A072VNK5_MEDTR|nr:hypothetical protein MTR_1g080472 [Medicago truncatula]RHN80641.1 hypothetical protein MtrunA17_Chr1g0190461 [Medicago truncatula]